MKLHTGALGSDLPDVITIFVEIVDRMSRLYPHEDVAYGKPGASGSERVRSAQPYCSR